MVKREAFLPALTLLLGAISLLISPLHQATEYLNFADQARFLGVPHAGDVLSNIGFVVAAGMAWKTLRSHLSLRLPSVVFCLALFAVALGSAYFHWDPTIDRLFWDRLPMSIAFTSLIAIFWAERMDAAIGARAFFPLVSFGAGSVLLWKYTGNLAPYYMVQFGGLAITLLTLILFPSRFFSRATALIALGLYALAKVVEGNDAAILAVTGWISGHTLKHLFAAVGCGLIIRPRS